MNGKWVTRTKLINDFLTGRMPNKMKVYYLMQLFKFGRKNPNGDDFYWNQYSSHYQGELNDGEKRYCLIIKKGDYIFENNKLKKINKNILPISPNAHLLTETIYQLNPSSVREVGVGGGDYLNNIFIMMPKISLHGVDVSKDQLDYLAKRHPHLKSFTSEIDIINDSNELTQSQISFTQAVIMHIGEKNNRHLNALKNLFNSTTETVLLSENWRKHNFFDDIMYLFDKRMINWKNINFYIRTNEESPESKLMICSSKKLPFDTLKNYQQLKD